MTADEKLIPCEPIPNICPKCRHYEIKKINDIFDLFFDEGFRTCEHPGMERRYWDDIKVPEDCPLKDEVLPVL